MPKVARYIAQQLKAKTVALIYVNNDYGKGGRDAIIKSLDALGVKVIAGLAWPACIRGPAPGRMDVSVDANGDLDRASFLVEAKGGKQEVKETLPALGKK